MSSLKDEIKEIVRRMNDLIEHQFDKEYHTKCDLFKDIQSLLDNITNLQEENTKKDNVINGIEEFIEYLDRETNVYLVNTAYTVILGKLKKLKIDNGLLQEGDKDES